MGDEPIIDVNVQDQITVISFGTSSISCISGVEDVARQLRRLLDETKPNKIVVDFCNVRFFSSQMLGLLVDMWRRLSEYGGIMLISGINPQLSRVFKITNLDKIFEFYPDKESAIKAAESR